MSIFKAIVPALAVFSALATWNAYQHIQDPPVTRVQMTNPAPIPFKSGRTTQYIPMLSSPTTYGWLQLTVLQPALKPLWWMLLTFFFTAGSINLFKPRRSRRFA